MTFETDCQTIHQTIIKLSNNLLTNNESLQHTRIGTSLFNKSHLHVPFCIYHISTYLHIFRSPLAMPWHDSSKQIGQISLEGCLLNSVSIAILPWRPHISAADILTIVRVPRSKIWPWIAVENWCWGTPKRMMFPKCVHPYSLKEMHWALRGWNHFQKLLSVWACEMKVSGK